VSGTILVRKKQVLAVPEAAVLHTGEHDLVFVSDGHGRFSPREVRVGMRGQGAVEIREGLKEGEMVSAGSNFLIDSESRIQGSYDSSDH
jgi:Cu(I)/Ag(I) efflux system membrane fusion protein